jgi:hypothetical protein
LNGLAYLVRGRGGGGGGRGGRAGGCGVGMFPLSPPGGCGGACRAAGMKETGGGAEKFPRGWGNVRGERR